MSIVQQLIQDPNLSPAFKSALAEQTRTLTPDQLTVWPNHKPADTVTDRILKAADAFMAALEDGHQWSDYSCEIEALHEMRGKVAAGRPLWGQL